MTRFADLQATFQRAILDGDDAVLSDIVKGPRELPAAMLGVYQNAYSLRLVEAIGKEHEMLRTFLGDETFDEMAAAYVAAHPSRHPSIRWISRHLPTFLGETEPYKDYPVVAEFAVFEKALNDAFDAPDGSVLTTGDLAAVAPEAWQDLVLLPSPSARRLTLTTNALAIWNALRDETDPPEAATLDTAEEIIIWRHDTTPMFRPMGREEAMMWDEAGSGLSFGQLCTMVATFDDPDGAAGRAATYLGSWVAAAMLAQAIQA
jgi:hypothetical protein